MGLFGSINKSKNNTSSSVVNNYDQRSVQDNTLGQGALQARDSASVTITDGGAIKGSLDLATTIAKQLGDQIGNNTSAVHDSFDTLAGLVTDVGSGNSASSNKAVVYALVGMAVVAAIAVQGRTK